MLIKLLFPSSYKARYWINGFKCPLNRSNLPPFICSFCRFVLLWFSCIVCLWLHLNDRSSPWMQIPWITVSGCLQVLDGRILWGTVAAASSLSCLWLSESQFLPFTNKRKYLWSIYTTNVWILSVTAHIESQRSGKSWNTHWMSALHQMCWWTIKITTSQILFEKNWKMCTFSHVTAGHCISILKGTPLYLIYP